jgi:predicted nucleic acid-binding protein
MFEQRVPAISEDIMFKWRILQEEDRKAGHTFSQPDLTLAATAQHPRLTVISLGICYRAFRGLQSVDPSFAGLTVNAKAATGVSPLA